MTVEIMFALVTATVLAAAVFGLLLVPAMVIGLAEPAGKTLLITGTVLGSFAALWRVVRVLLRFDARRHRRR